MRSFFVRYGRFTKNADPAHGVRPGRREWSYLPVAFLPKRFSKRATRPPVSRIFCLPV